MPMGTHTFTHEAMNTVFEFRIRHADANYARQAAQAAFAVVGRLESLLSRFVEGSDVWRINHAGSGETVVVSEECHECLREAVRLGAATGGAFDVSVGEAADLAKKHESEGTKKAPAAQLRAALKRSARALVSLSEDKWAAHVQRSGLSIDLGAIGKGFALDRARALLAEWEIKNALLSAGGSSVLAIGTESDGDGWVVNVAGDKQKTPVTLRDCALGSSGTSEMGRHIIDPRRGGQSYTHARTWALAPTAAAADALSTACMTMTPQEIARALRALGKGHAVITEDEDGRLRMCANECRDSVLECGTPVPLWIGSANKGKGKRKGKAAQECRTPRRCRVSSQPLPIENKQEPKKAIKRR